MKRAGTRLLKNALPRPSQRRDLHGLPAALLICDRKYKPFLENASIQPFTDCKPHTKSLINNIMKHYAEQDSALVQSIREPKDSMGREGDLPGKGQWLRSAVANVFKFMAMTSQPGLKRVSDLSADVLFEQIKTHGIGLLIHHGLSSDPEGGHGYDRTYHAVIVMDVLDVKNVGRIAILLDCQGKGLSQATLEGMKEIPELLKSSKSVSDALEKLKKYQGFLRAKKLDSIFKQGDRIYQDDIRRHEEDFGEINRAHDIDLMPAPHPPMLFVPDRPDERFKTAEEKLRKVKMAFDDNDKDRNQIED